MISTKMFLGCLNKINSIIIWIVFCADFPVQSVLFNIIVFPTNTRCDFTLNYYYQAIYFSHNSYNDYQEKHYQSNKNRSLA